MESDAIYNSPDKMNVIRNPKVTTYGGRRKKAPTKEQTQADDSVDMTVSSDAEERHIEESTMPEKLLDLKGKLKAKRNQHQQNGQGSKAKGGGGGKGFSPFKLGQNTTNKPSALTNTRAKSGLGQQSTPGSAPNAAAGSSSKSTLFSRESYHQPAVAPSSYSALKSTTSNQGKLKTIHLSDVAASRSPLQSASGSSRSPEKDQPATRRPPPVDTPKRKSQSGFGIGDGNIASPFRVDDDSDGSLSPPPSLDHSERIRGDPIQRPREPSPGASRAGPSRPPRRKAENAPIREVSSSESEDSPQPKRPKGKSHASTRPNDSDEFEDAGSSKPMGTSRSRKSLDTKANGKQPARSRPRQSQSKLDFTRGSNDYGSEGAVEDEVDGGDSIQNEYESDVNFVSTYPSGQSAIQARKQAELRQKRLDRLDKTQTNASTSSNQDRTNDNGTTSKFFNENKQEPRKSKPGIGMGPSGRLKSSNIGGSSTRPLRPVAPAEIMKSYYHTNGGKYTCQLKTVRLAKDGLQFSDGADPQNFFHLPSHCINTTQYCDGPKNPMLMFSVNLGSAPRQRDEIAGIVHRTAEAFKDFELFLFFEDGSEEAQTFIRAWRQQDPNGLKAGMLIPTNAFPILVDCQENAINAPPPRGKGGVPGSTSGNPVTAFDQLKQEPKKAPRPKAAKVPTKFDPLQPTLFFRSGSGTKQSDSPALGGSTRSGPLRRSTRNSGISDIITYKDDEEDDDDDSEIREGDPPPTRPIRPDLPLAERNVLLFHYPLRGRADLSITKGDRHRVEIQDFLNDTLLEFGLKYVISHLDEAVKEKVYLFNSFFYNKISSRAGKWTKDAEVWPAFQSVRKWTKGANIFERDFIVVPINENFHWFLAIILNPRGILQSRSPSPGPVPPLSDANGKGQPNLPTTRSGKAAELDVDDDEPELVTSSRKNPKSKRQSTAVTAIINSAVGDDSVDQLDCVELPEDGNNSLNEKLEQTKDRLSECSIEEIPKPPEEVPSSPPGGSILTDVMRAYQAQNKPSESESKENEPIPQVLEAKTSSPAPAPPDLSENLWDTNKCRILTFDSLGGRHSAVANHLSRWLQYEAKDKGKMPADAILPNAEYTEARVPQQGNFVDCGLFVIHYVDHFLRHHKEIIQFAQRKLPKIGQQDRRQWEQQMLKVWGGDATGSLRAKWVGIIDDLAAQYDVIAKELAANPDPADADDAASTVSSQESVAFVSSHGDKEKVAAKRAASKKSEQAEKVEPEQGFQAEPSGPPAETEDDVRMADNGSEAKEDLGHADNVHRATSPKADDDDPATMKADKPKPTLKRSQSSRSSRSTRRTAIAEKSASPPKVEDVLDMAKYNSPERSVDEDLESGKDKASTSTKPPEKDGREESDEIEIDELESSPEPEKAKPAESTPWISNESTPLEIDSNDDSRDSPTRLDDDTTDTTSTKKFGTRSPADGELPVYGPREAIGPLPNDTEPASPFDNMHKAAPAAANYYYASPLQVTQIGNQITSQVADAYNASVDRTGPRQETATKYRHIERMFEEDDLPMMDGDGEQRRLDQPGPSTHQPGKGKRRNNTRTVALLDLPTIGALPFADEPVTGDPLPSSSSSAEMQIRNDLAEGLKALDEIDLGRSGKLTPPPSTGSKPVSRSQPTLRRVFHLRPPPTYTEPLSRSSERSDQSGFTPNATSTPFPSAKSNGRTGKQSASAPATRESNNRRTGAATGQSSSATEAEGRPSKKPRLSMASGANSTPTTRAKSSTLGASAAEAIDVDESSSDSDREK